MLCPSCGSGLKHEFYEEVPLERCGSCGGVWLDHKELQLISQRKIENISPEVLDNYKHVPGINDVAGIERQKERKLKCPVCSGVMDLINYAYNSGIIIDRCPNDCGVYLDDKELEAAQAWAEMNFLRGTNTFSGLQKIRRCPLTHALWLIES